MDDIKFMKIALKIACKARGFTEPNPLVGAVVVKHHQVIATGYHRKYGEDHAELDALKKVTVNGTTLYVTLEPCIHFGKTPPCVDLIMEKKVQRVVVAMKDPNPLVNGKGIQKLKESGITVAVDVGGLGDIARKINRHYIKYITHKIPYVTLKAGISLDGKLTDKYRKSQWMTSEELRTFSHTLRGEFSAIMAGVKTIIDDNPQLNIREKAWGDKRLYRIVLDTHNTLDTRLRIFEDQEQFPLILFSSKEAENTIPKVKNHFFVTPHNLNGLNLREVLEVLYQQEIASVMVEGGGRLFNSFLQEELYDEIILSQAGTLIGGKESIQLFAEGTSVSTPIELKDREIIEFNTGCIIRGFRCQENWSNNGRGEK
jgi:diaminohydroxyphosphoribosylaminopyrimidine deaminase/5-amino-6-(5-phosphoribosylamino)uracil reductase